MLKVFIDGSAGTTGLRIRERLAGRRDVSLSVLPDELRKDPSARRDALNSANVAFLCLPDAAAVEAAAMVENPATVVIDTSTAHRTSDAWEYGFPEVGGRRVRIAGAKRIANPGCHASGFVALVEPLVAAGIVDPGVRLCAFSLTGYSGGGKKMIADYETAATPLHSGGRQYALSQSHKHLPEMTKVCGLASAPVFSPVVVPHFSGMETTVQVFADCVKGGMDAVKSAYRDAYGEKGGEPRPGVVRFVDDPSEGGFLSSAALSGSDAMEVSVHGNADRIVLVSRFDNLGKGASGAAIQNMNIATGLGETEGLCI
jgi:N-acetyl-gamma-glutamyl-phosphate reductase